MTVERRPSGFAWALGGVVLAALAVRVAYTLGVDPHVNDISDARTYHLLANHFADGDGWVRP
ncbi:MAG TPA: hypothetical protein VE642_01295, partial [Pyrinomonadaceae bacterium]|nr:hypothetical protein [Pyrinomonadaceae bacterium]